MKRRPERWREAAVAAVVLASATVGWTPGVSAQGTPGAEAFNIVGLRMSKVTLYRDCSMDKGVPFSREDLEKRKPWRATTDAKTAVYYWVKMDGGDYCVKAFAVETDRVVPVVKDEECRTRVAGRPPKTGAVRGVGESCN
jgi:hypothetical protein